MNNFPADHELNLTPDAGFADPEAWREFARLNGFKKVRSVAVPVCPDCGSSGVPGWGQYVYYSNLMRLLECVDCRLIWADRRIDLGVQQEHFEVAYKDDDYFSRQRRDIFRQLVERIDEKSPPNARILDVGGATGELMAQLKRRRPDVEATVFDVSESAVSAARKRGGLLAVSGDVEALGGLQGTFETVVLSDVLYYEPNLKALFGALGRLVSPGGSLILRLPNKAAVIRATQFVQSLRPAAIRGLQDRVKFFNPEHLYIIRRAYVASRLRSIGFTAIVVEPSPLLTGNVPSWARKAFFKISRLAWRLTLGTAVLTPGMLVVARREHSDSRE